MNVLPVTGSNVLFQDEFSVQQEAQSLYSLVTRWQCISSIDRGWLIVTRCSWYRPRVGPWQSPLIPSLPHLLYLLVSFPFFPFLIHASSIFLLFTPSHSTRIVSLRFHAPRCSRRLNVALVLFVLILCLTIFS